MNTDELAREIAKANRRMVELRRAARDGGPSPWSESVLAELSSALEELKVTEEELTLQNAELATAHAESELARQRYRELFMSAPFGQLVTDLKGTITEANRAAGDLFGTPSASLAGKGLVAAIAAADRDRFAHWLLVLADASHDASVCADCGGTGEFQLQPGGRGPAVTVEITAAPLADSRGRIDSIRWVVRDLSDKEKARRADRLAEEARRKDEFLAILAHELRNPLAAISLAADILTGPNGDPARKRWAAEVVQRHADQLRRLVEDLLDTSRVSHGKIALQPEPLDLRQVIAAAIESCHPVLEGKGHALNLSLPDAPVMVQGDPTRLTQVVANLVDNAAKYTPSGGQVAVGLLRNDGKVVVTVEDTGIGIDREMLDTIFGAYQQGSAGGKLREGGLGLGLPLVKQLVALHGGTVQASSDGEGKGARFSVELPAGGNATPAVASAPAAPLPPSPVAAAEPARVLVVDDNADAAELLADTVRRSGFAVEVAFDGRGAIAAALRSRCQVALVDLGLPDLDGLEVCRALKEAHPGLHLVAVTGYSDLESRKDAEQAGFDRFLVKPLDARQVVAALAELVGSRD